MMNSNLMQNPIVKAGVLLTIFAVGGTGLVAFTHLNTREKIIANERQALLDRLSLLVPKETVTNDMVSDTTTVKAPELLGAPETQVYLGRKDGAPVAAIFTSVVPDGYAGPIKLLVAVRADGSLGGVRVLSHKETPGLGDKIEEEKSDWINSFKDKSLASPSEERWKVKRDGGDWDQFTGATITPRSIVKAVKNTLLYFKDHQAEVFGASGNKVAAK